MQGQPIVGAPGGIIVLGMSRTLRLLFLPPYSPELNPQEHLC